MEEGATGASGWIRSIEAAAIAGIAYGVLAFVGLWLMFQYPELSLPETELVAWFQDQGNRTMLLLGLNLVSISSVAFLWFIAVVRRRLGDREDRFFTIAFLGSGIAFVAVWLAAAAALAAPAVAMDQADGATTSPASAALASGLNSALLAVIAPRLAAVFVLVVANLIRQTRVLPTWLAVASYVVGLGMLVVPIVARPVGFVFPAWVLLVSCVVLIDRPSAGE